MRKQELMELKAGQVVLDTRNNVELEIVGVGETKVILINGKEYSKSTLKRYFKLVEQRQTLQFDRRDTSFYFAILRKIGK